MDNSIELVIFDCDGVLVDSEPIAARVLAGFISNLGRETTVDDCLKNFTGLSMASVEKILVNEWGLELPGDFIQQLRALDFAAFARELKPLPGAAEAIKRITDGGIKVAVASSGSMEKISNSLALTNLDVLFGNDVFSASMVTNGKPAPDLFLLCADKMNSAPEKTIVIEDSAAGIRAGTAAGMKTVGFTGGGHAGGAHYREMLAAAGAGDIFSALGDFAGFISDNHQPGKN